MMHFMPCAFIPLGVFLGTAFIGALISGWVAHAAEGGARRRVPARSAVILVFPRVRSGMDRTG